jgi:hypothetical protein
MQLKMHLQASSKGKARKQQEKEGKASIVLRPSLKRHLCVRELWAQRIFTSGRSAASSALQSSELPRACTSARLGALATTAAPAAGG